MNRLRNFAASIGAAALIAATSYAPAVQAQDNVWGSWQKLSCGPLRVHTPFGGIESPRGVTLDGKQAMECTWVRYKNECPTVTSKLRHPVKCFNRSQKVTQTGENPPPN